MNLYIIVNRQQSKLEGIHRSKTTYFCGIWHMGEFEIQRWDGGRKDAYIFEGKAEANRYFKKHHLQERNEEGWYRISADAYYKDKYEIIKLKGV